MGKASRPNLDRLAILDERGFRLKLHPADVDGRLERLKPFVRWALIGLFVALPWISIGGHPAVLFDIPERRFYLFGGVFTPSDGPFLFFLLTAVGWSLVVITTLFGRLWCGWACPQTVYLEGVFRRIERVIEGPGAQRLQLDSGPWNARKIWKKGLKWSLWLVASAVIAHVFLSYFVSLPRLASYVFDDPREHWLVFVIASVMTLGTFFNLGWFREQLCLIVCPYGRLQSAMQDRDSITVGYDRARGEPRGKKSTPDDASVGDCVDCARCVRVCPTGIDIRNGLQMECIGCAACIDACDAVMRKLHRPTGLVRYDSERGFAREPRRVLRPRLLAYGLAGGVGLGVLLGYALAQRPFVARVTRPAGVPFVVMQDPGGDASRSAVQNQVMVHVENRTSSPAVIELSLWPPAGVYVVAPQRRVELAPGGRHDFPVVIRVPRAQMHPGLVVPAWIGAEDVERRVDVPIPVLGPGALP